MPQSLDSPTVVKVQTGHVKPECNLFRIAANGCLEGHKKSWVARHAEMVSVNEDEP